MRAATDWKETIPSDEEDRFARYAEEFGAMQKKRGPAARGDRALHAKANLGVSATFEVSADVPEEFRVGLFAAPKTYAAIVRFSNGAGKRQPDTTPDVRGLAVKVLGVGGKKIIAGLEDAPTQDFLAIRTPSVPMRDAHEFVTLVRAASSPALAPIKIIGALGLRRGFGLLRAVLTGLRVPTTSLATTSYFSALPIQFGPFAAHFAFLADAANADRDGAVPEVRGVRPNELGDALARRLKVGPLAWSFAVQLYQDATSTPIEDASVEWKVEDAPFHTLGRLTLPQQDAGADQGVKLAAWIEKLSFDPWHALVPLKPLGNIMRARNHAYRVSTQNRGAIAEPSAIPEL